MVKIKSYKLDVARKKVEKICSTNLGFSTIHIYNVILYLHNYQVHRGSIALHNKYQGS